ncbi:hypothetical protein EBU95_20790 [bacterium]|nr:hypothetical protein [bacterium]
MDLVLHKKLLALQAENAMLREEIQKLQEAKFPSTGGVTRADMEAAAKATAKRQEQEGTTPPATETKKPGVAPELAILGKKGIDRLKKKIAKSK